MAYDGWLKFGGSEIINADRTAAYITALTPSLQFTNCSECSDLRYLVNQKPHATPGEPEEILFGQPSDFENNSTTNGWTPIGSGTTEASSTTHVAQGSRSLLVTWPTAAIDVASIDLTNPALDPRNPSALDPGRVYTVTAQVWVPVGSPAVKIGFVQSGVYYWGLASSTTGAWQTISVIFTAVNSQFSVLIRPVTATTAGQQVWIDDVHVIASSSIAPQSGEYIEEVTRYRSPILDAPEWFDPNDEDTWGFAGLYPLRIRGLEDDSRSATVTESAHDGGFVSLPRKATKEITVEGLLVANSEASLSAGHRWLRKALDGSGCGAGGSCEGDDLCFFTACPPDVPLEGYDYDGPTMVRSVPGAYGWQAFGGTYSRNTSTGVGTYTSNNAGVAYAEYSPFKTVCDPMKFTVNFVPESLAALTSRTNMVLNPSYRASSGTRRIRTNHVTNPVGKTSTIGWTGVGSGSVNIAAKGPDTHSPNAAGQIGLQDRYIRVEANATINKAGAGLRTVVDNLLVGRQLLASALVKTVISGVTKVQIKVTYLNEDGDPIFGGDFISSEQTVVVGTWTRINYVVPAAVTGTVKARVEFLIGTSMAGTFAAAQNPLYVSEVLVEQTRAVPDWDSPFYFDGDQGYTYTGLTRTWIGTPNQSESALVGPDLPNTLVGANYHTSASDYSNVRSYRSGTAESTVFVMGMPGFTNTNKALQSPNMPVISGRNFYAARVTVQHLDGPQAALGVVLRLRALDASGASLGIVATSTDTGFPLSVGGTANVTAPSTLSLPGGTVNLRAEVWLNTGATVVPTILKVTNFLVEPVDALSTQPGAFFDGETMDVPGSTQYSWTGQANYSTSIAADPVTLEPYNVRLEAWGAGADDPLTIDTFIGGIDGYSSDGSITFTVEGGEWETVAWRLVPLDTDPVQIASVTYEWHQYYGYGDPFATDASTHPLGYYTEDPPATPPSIGDPIITMLDGVTRRYFRSMRRVTAVAGPTIVEQYSSNAAHMARVEFTLVAGVPFIYGDEVEAGVVDLSVTAQSSHTYADDSFLIAEVIPDCVSLTDTSPVVDPACAAIPSPPTVPSIMSICNPSTGPVVNRYGFRVSSTHIPQWGDVVPIIEFKPDAPISQLTVKFYPTPVPNTSPADVDPCAMCAGFVINYADTNGIVIDGANERVYSPVPEMATGPGGAIIATGAIVERPARHLVSSLDFGPMEWPVLSCGIGYLVVVETYAATDGMMTINLVARQ